MTLKDLDPTMPSGSRFNDLTGQAFGKLTVVKYAGKKRDTFWLCSCECGGERVVRNDQLTGGKATTCGAKHHRKKFAPPNKKEKRVINEMEYHSWQAMKGRCYNPKNNRYYLYGKRGITVCNRWLNDYQSFLADMGRKPTPEHSIDRIDTDGNYEPSNCRWATPKEQARNRGERRSRRVTYNGETRPVTEWAEIVGINHRALYARIFTSGWGVERAMTEPLRVWSSQE